MWNKFVFIVNRCQWCSGDQWCTGGHWCIGCHWWHWWPVVHTRPLVQLWSLLQWWPLVAIANSCKATKLILNLSKVYDNILKSMTNIIMLIKHIGAHCGQWCSGSRWWPLKTIGNQMIYGKLLTINEHMWTSMNRWKYVETNIKWQIIDNH